jgi:tetratricopeptide (TPR) repeat protein
MSTPAPQPPPLSVFISYSHKDEDLREELDVHLALLKRQGKIWAWHDRAIEAGTEWDSEIKHQLETADVILLLISPRFIASDYCYDLEMQRAIQRHDEGTARVIPILLKPCDWQGSPFSKLAILPKDAKPITTWTNQDEAFLNVTQGIRRAVESLQAKKHPGATLTNSAPAIAPLPPPPSPTPLPLSTYNPATFTGRDHAIAHLTQTLHSGCRLLIIHGMTGIGKTTLAESLAARAYDRTPLPSPSPSPSPSPPPPYIQVVLDRTLPSPTFTQGAIAILHAMGDDTAQQLPDDQILPYLLKVLTEKPCWLQLDSLEFLLRQDENGDYHFTDPTWTDFFCQFLSSPTHPTFPISPILLTSQALPVDLVEGCDRLSNRWHDYPLRGIEEIHWLDLFRNYGVKIQNSTEENYLCQIARYFDGHPLILKMIAGDIRKSVFGGSVTKYWQNYYSQQTRPKLHQSQEQRARHWVNQTLQTLPPLALQMLQHCSVFRRPVPESFYLQILDTPTSPPSLTPPSSPTNLTPTLNILKSRYLVEEKDIQNGEIVLQMHNLIRDAAYSQLTADHPTWEAAERKAADLWLTAYQPAPDAENLETVRGYLEAFDHYCEVEDWEAVKNIAWTRLGTPTQEYLCWQLGTWGYFREKVLFHSKQLDLAQKMKDTQEISWALSNLGNAYDSLGNYERAIDYHQQSLVIKREISDRRGEGNSLGNLGNAFYSLSNYEQAINYYQQHLAIAREIGDRLGEGNALGNLGSAYHSLGNYEQAIDYHQQSLAIAREIGDRLGESHALGNLGNVYNSLSNYERAIDYHQQSLVIKREIGNRQGEGNSLGNLGNAHYSLGNYERAIDYHQQYLTIGREIGDRRGEGNALSSLGLAYYSLGNYERAIDYHQQCLTIAREIGNRLGEAIALGNLGDARCSLGNHLEALQLQNQKLAIALEIQSRDTEAYALSGLGEVLTKLEQYPEALEALTNSLKICQEIGERSLKAEVLKNLAELHQQLGEGAVALEYCQQASTLSTQLGIPLQKECETLMAQLNHPAEEGKNE